MEAWQEHFTLCPFRRGQWRRRCLFIVGAGAGKFLGLRRIFARISPNLPEKFFVQFCLQFSPTKIMKTFFWCDLQKKVFMCFFANLGVIFWSQTTLGAIYSRIFRNLLRFSTNQNFRGCACTPCTPTSNTTTFHNSIIGNFMVYQDWLETKLLQLFEHPENSEWFSTNFVIIFEVSIVDEQKQTYLLTFCLFFTSFHCSQLFYCSSCPTAAPASLNMHVVSTNFAKPLVCKREYDVILWHHKQRIPSNNDHHTPLLNTRIR